MKAEVGVEGMDLNRAIGRWRRMRGEHQIEGVIEGKLDTGG